MSQIFRQYPQQFLGLLDLIKTLLSVSHHPNAIIQNPISNLVLRRDRVGQFGVGNSIEDGGLFDFSFFRYRCKHTFHNDIFRGISNPRQDQSNWDSSSSRIKSTSSYKRWGDEMYR